MDNYSELRPNVGVSVVPMTYSETIGEIMVLVYVRPSNAETYPNKLALPNGFMNIQKHLTLEDAANDALKEKTGAKLSHIENFNAFSGSHIDHRRITVNVGFISLHNGSEIVFDNEESFGETKWMKLKELISMSDDDFAFNHKEVLDGAWKYTKEMSKRTSHHAKMLNSEFSIPDFRKLTELIIGEKINDRTFRTRLEKYKVLVDLGKVTPKMSSIMGTPKSLYKISKFHDGTFIL